MNKVILMGRLTRDPEVRYSQGDQATAVARYTLAVDRRFRRDNDQQTADFIGCVAFGKLGEFAEKYLRKGTKVVVTGRIQTGSYTNKDGQKSVNLLKAKTQAEIIPVSHHQTDHHQAVQLEMAS